MAEQLPPAAEILEIHDVDPTSSVVMRQGVFGAVARAAGSPPALALAALILATATLLSMSVATDFGDIKLYTSRGFNNLEALRWIVGARTIFAVVALGFALVAGIRYARELPATRYTFADVDDREQEPVESIEGTEAPGWVRMLVGASVAVALLAVILNGVALIYAFQVSLSPNFGLPNG